MAETEAILAAEPKVETAKVASAGKIERVTPTPNQAVQQVENNATTTSQNVEPKADEAITEAKATPSTISEDQRKAFLKDIFGDENIDVEAVKEKLKPAPSKEDKKKADSENEIRLIKLFVENGGTTDQYNEIKTLATSDMSELSKKEIKDDLISKGFSESEADGIIKERYYQIELDNIEQDFDNETDEEFEARKKLLQKKVELGTKKLASHSSYKQQQAANILKGLADAIESQDLEAKQEATISSNVDELLSKLPRKQTIELGQYDNVQLAPVEHEVSEDSIKQVATILRDPAQRNNFFKNQDGTLNLPKLTEVLLNNFELKRAIKGALLEGQTRMTAEFQKTFPARNPYELGVGGSPQKFNGKGAVASAGKVQKVSPQHN